jgi:hypothetical protein
VRETQTQTQTQRRTRRSINKNEMGKMGIIRVGIRVLIFFALFGRMDGGELMSADMVISRKRKRKTRISSSCCCFSLAQLLILEIQYQGRRRRISSGHYFSDAIQCLIHWVLP